VGVGRERQSRNGVGQREITLYIWIDTGPVAITTVNNWFKVKQKTIRGVGKGVKPGSTRYLTKTKRGVRDRYSKRGVNDLIAGRKTWSRGEDS